MSCYSCQHLLFSICCCFVFKIIATLTDVKLLDLTFVSLIFWPSQVACRFFIPQPGIEPMLPAMEAWVLTTGLPGKSWVLLFLIQTNNMFCFLIRICVCFLALCNKLCYKLNSLKHQTFSVSPDSEGQNASGSLAGQLWLSISHGAAAKVVVPEDWDWRLHF